MANWAKPLALDKNQNPLQEYPAPNIALSRMTVENAVASSVLLLNPNTSTVEVGTVGGLGAVIRWVPLTETPTVSPYASVVSSGVGANFDHFIPANSYRRFVVPRETQGLGTATMQLGSTFGLYQRLARVNATTTASSVLISEY